MEVLGWRFFSKYLSENEILEALAKMQKEEEKIEAGDWVRVLSGYSDRLTTRAIYKVKEAFCNYITLHDNEFVWTTARFELVRKHDAPFKVGDLIKEVGSGAEFTLDYVTSVMNANDPLFRKYYELVEPVESIQYKKEKEEMFTVYYKSNNNGGKTMKQEEYKLCYKQVKDFSVKDLEEAGACETAVLKILRDKQCLYEAFFNKNYWNDYREQYFNQDFNGVNGLVWLEKHGFIQKIEPEYIYAKDLKYGEYAILHEGDFQGNLVCKPYRVDKIISVVDPNATWSDPYVKVKHVDKNKVEVSYRFKD